MRRARKGDDFLACGGEVIFPQFGVAWETDPDGLVLHPFGGLAVGQFYLQLVARAMAPHENGGNGAC